MKKLIGLNAEDPECPICSTRLKRGGMSEYFIIPVAKPRMTRADKWRKRPATTKYWNFVDLCKRNRVALPCFGAHVIFILPMPTSWSKKKRVAMDGQPHMQKPDWDNLGKAISDAIYKDDSGIYDIHITKLWGKVGKIIIEEGVK